MTTTLLTSPVATRRIVIFAWIMAAAGTVLGQLHTLARVASHPEDLEYPLTAAWAVPAMGLFAPLLEWGHPYFVYWTYGKIWLPVFVAFTLCAFLVHHHRRPSGFEKGVWRVALTGYVIATASVFGEYYTPWVDQAFLFLALPGLLLTALASTALGIVLLRNNFRPRTTAFLLVAFIPLAIASTQVTSMGNVALPLMWGWALAGQHLLTAGRDERTDPLAEPLLR